MKSNFIFFLLLILISCEIDPNKQIDEGQIDDNLYQNVEIGWTMEIPSGWKITHRSTLKKRLERGSEVIKETSNIDYDYSRLKQLVNFQKDKRHVFQSTSEPFNIEYEGEWEETNMAVKGILCQAYEAKGINIDTSSSKEKIDDLIFDVFHIKMYGPNGEVILYQDMYSRYINGYDFSAILNYFKGKEKTEMMTAWKQSKFKIRD